jgi:hypothetical protein
MIKMTKKKFNVANSETRVFSPTFSVPNYLTQKKTENGKFWIIKFF